MRYSLAVFSLCFVLVGASQLRAEIGTDLQHRNGVDVDSVNGCLEGCVGMIAGLQAMTNPSAIAKQEGHVTLIQMRCEALIELLSPEDQADVDAELVAQCLGD